MTERRAQWALGLVLSALGAIMLILFERADNELSQLAKNVSRNTATLEQHTGQLARITSVIIQHHNANRQLHSQ